MQPPAPPPAPRLTQIRYNKDQDSIRRFQENQLSEHDEQWDRLVPEETRASLPEREVKLQEIIFEIIKSEKEYVADLEVLQDVFLTPLFDVRLPIIDLEKQTQFREKVFSNFHRILAHERRFLAALYERQRKQYPVITSVSDIILDAVLAFREDYESYIKHYPLAEARHGRELKRNKAYKAFLSETAKNPRARKRDLITLVSQPVKRLPRLNLMLYALKVTLEGHTDRDAISLVYAILFDFLKSTEPGVKAARDRVRCFALSENLVFRKTEIIDLDFDGENRTLAHEGTVGRKEKVDTSSSERWVDSSAMLLDHYFILTERWIDTDPVRKVDMEKDFSGSTHQPSTLEGAPKPNLPPSDAPAPPQAEINLPSPSKPPDSPTHSMGFPQGVPIPAQSNTQPTTPPISPIPDSLSIPSISHTSALPSATTLSTYHSAPALPQPSSTIPELNSSKIYPFSPMSNLVSTAISSSTFAASSALLPPLSAATTLPSGSPSGNPLEWTVEQVVEWARNRGFGEGVCAKFQEREITGDILLEFDIQMLKEIDIPAFGKRMRIANAIQELRGPASASPDAATVVPYRVAVSYPNAGVNSHPIPLDFLRLGSFIGPPEQRKPKYRNFPPTEPVYPFLVFHAGNLRRYILYASSEWGRNKWKEVLEETKILRDVWMDGNKLFGFNVIQDGRFRSRTMLVPSSMANAGFTGRIICATAFRRHERNFLAIATEDGIYLGLRDNLDRSVQVLRLPNVTHMIALASHDCFVLIVDGTLHSYSLEPLTSVALGQVPSEPVEQTMEILAPQHEGRVAFFRVGSFGDQDYLVYGTPGPVHTAIHTLLITRGAFQPRKGNTASLLIDAYDAYFMSKNYAIVSEKGITVLDPNDYSRVMQVPDFSERNSNAATAALESQCDSAKALGIIDVSQHERLVIYDEHGCYIDIHGKPMRDCKWVRWEIKAKSFSYRHPHLLLVGDYFIDIRHVPTGQFKQMVEARDIRLLDSVGIGGWKGSLFLEWRGSHDDKDGQSWALVEGLETAPL